MSETGESRGAPGTGGREPRLVAGLARLLLATFFRRVEVTGASRLPLEGPLVLVANHTNSLIDPALLVGFLPRRPRILAKSTLWEMAILRPFLRLAAAIPVYRRQDPGADPARNREAFAECHRVLAGGGSIAIFPEGTSHNEPALVPLKTGVSRIVLEAEERYGPLGVEIAPVGLVFEKRQRFRSRALVKVGEPIDPTPEIELYASDKAAAVRALTERVRAALEAVTLNFPSWQEARWIERAVEIYRRPSVDLPSDEPLAESFATSQRFIAGYEELRERHPERVERVAAKVRAYDDLLRLAGLRDEQVAARYPTAGMLRFTLKSGWLLAVRLPLAVVGTAIHLPAYLAARWFARRYSESEDMLATYKVMSGMVFYLTTWLAVAVATGWAWGGFAAVLALLLAPLSGLVALRFHERRQRFDREARAYVLLHTQRQAAERLRGLRAEILEEVRELVVLYVDSNE